MALPYGVELDAGRAERTRTKGIEVIHGNCFDVQCPVESFSLIYLNPPYGFEIGEEKSQRMEKLFLESTRAADAAQGYGGSTAHSHCLGLPHLREYYARC